MSFLEDLHQYLVAGTDPDPDRQAALTLIQSQIAQQISIDDLTEGAGMPAFFYSLISNHTEHTLEGQPDGLLASRVEINVCAEDPVTRLDLGEAVKAALDGVTNSFLENTEINVLLWDNEIDSYEPERKQYRKMLDFRIMYG